MSSPQIRAISTPSTGTGTNVGGTPGNYVSDIVVNRPAGTADGDVLEVAILTDGSAVGQVQTLSGWTANPANPLTLTSDGSRAYLFSKVASSEPSTWTFKSDLNNGNDYTAVAVAVSGAAAQWNKDSAHSTINNTGSFSPVTLTESGVTTTVPESLLLYFGFGDPSSSNTGTWTDPSGWTAGAQSFSNYCPVIVVSKVLSAAGASGSAAATLTFLTGTCGYAAIIVPIAPVLKVGTQFRGRRNMPGRGPYSRGRYYRPRLEHRGSPASSFLLVVADATHAHAADAPSLSQANTLAVADSTHGHVVDALSLIQAHVLAVQEALHAHAAEAPALTQANTLAVGDATHGQSVDGLALVQAHVLAMQDALHAHASEAPTLSEANLLAVGDATHGHSAEALALTQGNVLAVADALHSQTAEAPALVQAHVLAVADALHAHAAEQITLSTGETLAPSDAMHGHAADAVSLTQANVLVVQETSHGNSVEQITLSQATTLAIADALHAHAAEALTLGYGALLVVADAGHGHAAESPSLTQAGALIVSDALHAHLAEALDLRMPHEPGDIQLFVVTAGDRLLVVAPSQRLYTVQ